MRLLIAHSRCRGGPRASAEWARGCAGAEARARRGARRKIASRGNGQNLLARVDAIEPGRLALRAKNGEAITYGNLRRDAARLAQGRLGAQLEKLRRQGRSEIPVVVVLPDDADFVVASFAVWKAGGVGR